MQNGVEKSVKLMREKKTTGSADVPGDILNLLRGDGLRIMKKLINNNQRVAQGFFLQLIQWP